MTTGSNFLNEHIIEKARVHYAITDTGGVSPNVVQAQAEVLYLIRAPEMADAEQIFARIEKIAQGAALMTETQVSCRFEKACSSYLPNRTLEAAMYQAVCHYGTPAWSDEERAFAAAIRATLSANDINNSLNNIAGTSGEEGKTFAHNNRRQYGSRPAQHNNDNRGMPMSMSSIPSSSPGGKRYGWVEKIGNKVPHPFLLFIYLIAVLIAATAILSALNVGVQNPTDGSRVVVKNLLSVEGLHWFLPNVIKNFSGFAPLGAILALVLGAGFAERVGLLPALMVKMASHVSARYASYMVLFIAFFSHISSDAALVIMPPLGALMFLAVGRHPVAGLLAAIAGVGCGFTANLLIVTTDVLLSGISTEAAKSIDASLHVSVIDNWYFMATSVIVLTLVGGLITDKLVEPRLGQWQGSRDEKLQTLTPGERFGLRIAGVATLVFVAVIALMVVPENGICSTGATWASLWPSV